MIRQGVVIGVSQGEVRVSLAAECDGERCASCGLCGGGANRERLELTAACELAVSPGDRVIVEVKQPHQGLLALVVFGLPLAGIIGGGAGGYALGSGADLALVAGGALGFAAGFGAVWLAARLWPALRGSARVTDKLGPA